MENNKSIDQKLYEIQQQKIELKRNKYNEFTKSNYVSLPSLLEKVMPILKEKNILVKHYGESGFFITELVCQEGGGSQKSSLQIDSKNPQTTGSSITYFMRYNLCAMLNIVPVDDDDGNGGSGRTNHKKKQEDNRPRFNNKEMKKLKEKLDSSEMSEDEKKKLYDLIHKKYRMSNESREAIKLILVK